MSDNEPVALQIPIEHIRPDPAQPRKLLPPDLAEEFISGKSPFEILAKLNERAKRNKWMRERLTRLSALAHSIDEDGLMNPIRVFSDGADRYTIEAGERRWWAHHLLVAEGKEQFKTIAAFVGTTHSQSSGLLRRRVAENVQRSDFTAIELAQAMSNRIQEILADHPGMKRSDAEKLVAKENGMTDRRVRQFVALLNLSPEAQALAQQARLTENALRLVAAIKDASRQLEAARRLMRPTNPKGKPRSWSQSRGVNQRKSVLRAQSRERVFLRQRRTEFARGAKNASQQIQQMLVLARSLHFADWDQAVRKKQVRRALLRLHDTLALALRASKGS